MNGTTWIGSPNHYNGRNGHAISHITLHIMVGTLTGTDSVFNAPEALQLTTASEATERYTSM